MISMREDLLEFQFLYVQSVGAGVPGSQTQLDGTVPGAIGQHQDQPGAKDISSRQSAGLGDAAEFQTLVFGEDYAITGHIGCDASLDTSNVYSGKGQ